MSAADLARMLDPAWRNKVMPDCPRLTISDLAMLQYLAYRIALHGDFAFPSLGRIARDLSSDRKTVIRIIERLGGYGWVRWQHCYDVDSGEALSNRYFLPTGPAGNRWAHWDERFRDEGGRCPIEITYDGQFIEADEYGSDA